MGDIIIWAVGIVLICGFLYYLLLKLTIIAEPFKSLGLWSIMAIGGILFIVKVIMPLIAMLVGAF